MLKRHAWPRSGACKVWRFSPSMRQRIDAAGLYATAPKQVRDIDRTVRLADANPLSLGDRRAEARATLLSRVASNP